MYYVTLILLELAHTKFEHTRIQNMETYALVTLLLGLKLCEFMHY